jgi:hypothetical protein
MAKSGSVKTGTWSAPRVQWQGERAGERMGHPPARCPFPYMNLDNGK